MPDDDTERLIVRAAQAVSYGSDVREIAATFEDEGVDRETAYLTARAGRVMAERRSENPQPFFWAQLARGWSRSA